MATKKWAKVPDLAIDKILYPKFGVSPRGKLERRIVANLIAHLKRAGFRPYEVDDREEVTKVKGTKDTMELLFNLDEAWVFFTNGSSTHWVYFTMGEGTTMICDHSFTEGDPDGFLAAMDAFEAEDYA
jgi:hypothetical protein